MRRRNLFFKEDSDMPKKALIVGQTCSGNGRNPDPSKVDAIMRWPSLKNPREVRRFLGLCGTVRVWIKDYSKIIRLLTELYRTGVEFVWDEICQEDHFSSTGTSTD
jgi:hypothetical protein